MRSDHDGEKNKQVGVELKYCEHCGGLWVRECGAGTVYCEKCQPKVADLPAAKARRGRLSCQFVHTRRWKSTNSKSTWRT